MAVHPGAAYSLVASAVIDSKKKKKSEKKSDLEALMVLRSIWT